MIHEIRLTCVGPAGDRVVRVEHYADPRERREALEKLSAAARHWRGCGYPMSFIEDDAA